MNIIAGRGRRRKNLIEFPHGSIVNQSPKDEQVGGRILLCQLLSVDPTNFGGPNGSAMAVTA